MRARVCCDLRCLLARRLRSIAARRRQEADLLDVLPTPLPYKVILLYESCALCFVARVGCSVPSAALWLKRFVAAVG